MAGIELSLAGKTALITGGSRGIGAETVRLFRTAGARVAFSYRQAGDAARALEKECARPGMRESAAPDHEGALSARSAGASYPFGPRSGLHPVPEDGDDLNRGRGRGSAQGTTGSAAVPGGISGRGRGPGLEPGWSVRVLWGNEMRSAGSADLRSAGSADLRPPASTELRGTPLGMKRPGAESARDAGASTPSGAESATGSAEEDKIQCVGIEQALETVADGRALVKKAVAALGRLDILVVNHGIWPPGDAPVAAMSDAQWRRTIGVNLDAVFGLVSEYAAQARLGVGSSQPSEKRVEGEGNAGPSTPPDANGASGSAQDDGGGMPAGHIVLISSTAGQRGEAFHADYAASKGALISLTKSLSSELAPRGIRVNCVAPGWVDTDMAAGTLDDPQLGPKVRAGIPVGRVATPREIAGPVLFLCTPLAGFISGEVVNVNGGAVLVG